MGREDAFKRQKLNEKEETEHGNIRKQAGLEAGEYAVPASCRDGKRSG